MNEKNYYPHQPPPVPSGAILALHIKSQQSDTESFSGKFEPMAIEMGSVLNRIKLT